MKTLCIDGNSIVNRAYYGIRPLTTRDGIFTNGILGFLNILFKLKEEVEPEEIVCAFDLREPTFRHKKYSEYKAGRHGMPEELAMQLPYLKEIITALGFKVLSLPGYEADDLLGTLSRMTEEKGGECFIATGDRDSLQLISPKTKVFLFKTEKGQPVTTLCDESYVLNTYGVMPKEMLDVKALMGDQSDNIPGVPGVGEKTALSLISKYRSIDKIYENLEEIDATKSVKNKLALGKESAYLSRFLGEICRSAPIKESLEEMKIKEENKKELFGLLTKLEMFSFIKKLGLEGMTLDAPKDEKEAPLKVFRGSLEDISSLKEKDEISVFTKGNGSYPKGFAFVFGEKLFFFERGEDSESFDSCYEALLKTKTKKSTFNCKDMFRFCHRLSFDGLGDEEKSLVSFDIVLAAYLLDANSKSYDEDSLLSVYGVPNCSEISLGEETTAFNEEQEEDIKKYIRLYYLEKQLKKEAEEKGQMELLQTIEIPLANVLASMETIGFFVDREALSNFGDMLTSDIAKLEEEIFSIAGESFNINSPKQLGQILFVKLGLPPKKKTKTGFSTSSEVLEELANESEIVSLILKYRQLAKLKSTYVDGLSKEIKEDGKIHSHFIQTETRTGRISSAEPNLQNIPVRTELGREIRRFFKADEGCKLIDADYSQIELRVLAHISGDETMISAFESGEDIHTKTASEVFGLPVSFITPELRSRAKAVNFGIVYGIGAFSLSKDIGSTVKEADNYIKSYLNRFSAVKNYMDETIDFAKENGFVKTLYGRRREIPEIRSTNHNLRAFGERAAMNTPIQGTAADIIKIAMIKVYNRLKKENMKSRLILQIHDELIVLSPEEETEKASKLLKEEMENAVKLKVKLIAETKVGDTWFETK